MLERLGGSECQIRSTRLPSAHPADLPALTFSAQFEGHSGRIERQIDRPSEFRGHHVFYHAAAESLARRRDNLWTSSFAPFEIEIFDIVNRRPVPGNSDSARGYRQRSVFQRIGAKFVERQCERQRLFR